MKKYMLLVLLVIFGLFIGCSLSENPPKLVSEKSDYNLEKTDPNKTGSTSNNVESKNSINGLQLRYIDYTYKKVLIKKEIALLGLPESTGPIINKISNNTVVKVLKSANVKDNIWLYVEIPVFDTPVDFRGWVRESDTIQYTKEQIKLVQSPITIKPEEFIYDVDEFSQIQSNKPIKAKEDDWGRIEEKRNDYVRIECPGGRTIWVKESSIVYPEVE